MDVDGSPLAAEHGVRHVGAAVGVGVTDSEDADLAGTHAAGDVDLVVGHVEAHLLRQDGALRGRVVGDEGTALNRLTLGEMDQELVELSVRGPVPVGGAILDTLDALNRAVLDLDVPGLELLFPALVLSGGSSLALGVLGSVDKGNDVGEQGVGL